MNRIIASKLETPLAEGLLPTPAAWEKACAVRFCRDWKGGSEDPRRETEVRMLWSGTGLYIRFQCHYRELYVFDDRNSRRDQLWLRDVAEAFIQIPADGARNYREFEISPNGDWLDLDIAPGTKTHLCWKIASQVIVQPENHLWTADMAIPMELLAPHFNPQESWRINLFRIEGPEPDRFYSAWQPTYTPKANFHVPECFGELRFDNV